MRHFEAFELVDKKTFERMGEGSLDLFSPVLLAALDDFRDFVDRKTIVNNWRSGGPFQWRGARTRAKAIELGAPRSMHLTDPANNILCRAIDCDVEGMTAEEVRQMILADPDNPLVCTITRLESGVDWIHFDVMELPAGVERIHLFHA